MRVLLIQTPPWRPDIPALGLPYVQGALRSAGHETTLLDLNIALYSACAEEDADASRWGFPTELRLEVSRELWDPPYHFAWYELEHPLFHELLEQAGPFIDGMLEEALEQHAPALVGVTAVESQCMMALELCRRVKRLRPDVRTVIGGPSCFGSYEPQLWAADKAVDFVVVGEGEQTIVELAATLEAGAGDWPRGLLVMEDGTPRSTGHRPVLKELDELPLPDFTGLELGAYRDRGRLPMMWSRGCVQRCAFCIECRIWERYRCRSAAHVHREIRRNVEEYGITHLEVNDSVFNGNVRMLTELCDRLIADEQEVYWGGQGILSRQMQPELLGKLHGAGCRFITYGLESASSAVLKRMGKHHDARLARRVIRATHEAGIGVMVNFMFGFPGETEEDFQETLDFLEQVAPWVDIANPSDALTGIVPGTDLYDRHEEFGVSFRHGNYWWESEDGSNTVPVRIERFERLCALAEKLGLDNFYGHREFLNRDEVLAQFYRDTGRKAPRS